MGTPYWKNRRIAPRVLRILARRGAESRAVKVYETSLPPKTAAFMAAYDAAARYEGTKIKEMAEGKSAIANLVGVMRAWLPLLVRDVPGFDPSIYADSPSVPDDVLADAERLVGMATDFRDAAGAPLPYAADLAAELPIEAAAREWEEAETADKNYQTLLADVRSTDGAFEAELQLFRKTLLAAFGRNDKDYQKIRASRAAIADEEDDPVAPPATVIEPAPAGTTSPTR